MKTKVLMMVILFAALAAIDTPSFAHHGAAAFDMNAPVVLKNAVVTEFLWINPHPLIKADYTDPQGNVEHWTMEMGSTVSAQLDRLDQNDAPARRRGHAVRLAGQDGRNGWTLQQGRLPRRHDHA